MSNRLGWDKLKRLLSSGNTWTGNQTFNSLVYGPIKSLTTEIKNFTTTETKSFNITGFDGNNFYSKRISLFVSDQGASIDRDEDFNIRLSLYNSDSATEDELIDDFSANLTYTQIGSAVTAAGTSIIVDDSSGLVQYNFIQIGIGGTTENVRITGTPTASAVSVSVMASGHAATEGLTRIAEITTPVFFNDLDSTGEVHGKLETLGAPNDGATITVKIEY